MSADGRRLLTVSALLTAVGLVMLFSASAVTSEGNRHQGDAAYYLTRQLFWTGLSLTALVVASKIGTERLVRWRVPLLVLTAVLLAALLIPGVGSGKYGARRWLSAGGLNLQPSEFAKLTLQIFLCAHVAADPDRLRSFWRGLVPGFAAILLIAGLVVVEPDVGTAVFLGVTGVAILFAGGARMRHLLPIGAGAAAAGLGLALLRMDHFRTRLMAWLEPETHRGGYQLSQSLIALGSGGWVGEGLGRGTQKLSFLPEVHSDFIFAVVGEELGWVGAAAVIALFVAFGVTGWRIARSADRPFSALLAFGLTLGILLQAALNIAVVTGMVPTKGIPLPFLSYGGSSLVCTMTAIGLLVRIAEESRPSLSASSAGSAPSAVFLHT